MCCHSLRLIFITFNYFLYFLHFVIQTPCLFSIRPVYVEPNRFYCTKKVSSCYSAEVLSHSVFVVKPQIKIRWESQDPPNEYCKINSIFRMIEALKNKGPMGLNGHLSIEYSTLIIVRMRHLCILISQLKNNKNQQKHAIESWITLLLIQGNEFYILIRSTVKAAYGN